MTSYRINRTVFMILNILLMSCMMTLFGQRAEDYQGIIGPLEPNASISTVSLNWSSLENNIDTSSTPQIYNPRLKLPTYIHLFFYYLFYTSGFDTNRVHIEMVYPKEAHTRSLSGKPLFYDKNINATSQPGLIQWDGPVRSGRHSGDVELFMPMEKGEYKIGLKIMIRGAKWQVKYGERPDVKKEGYFYYGGPVFDKDQIERFRGPWRIELIDKNYIYEMIKKYHIIIDRDSSLLLEVTNDGKLQLIQKEYSPYFKWLQGITPALQLLALKEMGFLDYRDDSTIYSRWVTVFDTTPGMTERLEKFFEGFKFYITGSDSIEYIQLCQQIAQQWDSAIDDYRTGRVFMTPARDTFFYLSGIVARLQELTKKREKLKHQ